MSKALTLSVHLPDSSAMETPDFLIDGPRIAPRTVVLAHGAGSGMDSDFLAAFAAGLAAAGCRVVRFEFPYMARRRREGVKAGPDALPVLLETWRTVVAALGGGTRLVLGGKSMGGRIASLVADDVGAAGLVCLGYPFHPAGRPEQTRVEHLAHLRTPTLIVQGTRDTLGTREDVAGYRLSPSIRLHWVEDGDHSLSPRVASGRTKDQAWAEGIAAVVGFVRDVGKD
jgi:predicted alpha/beta-hydrolase family hydrolase